jgi:hypothetical protein
MKNFAKHLPHYLALFGVLFLGVLAFYLFSYDQTFQVGVIVATALSYVAWGVIHHAIHRDLHLAVFIEYLAIATLGLVIVFSLIFRT